GWKHQRASALTRPAPSPTATTPRRGPEPRPPAPPYPPPATATQMASWLLPVPQTPCPGPHGIVDQHPILVLDDVPDLSYCCWYGNRSLLTRQPRRVLPLLAARLVLHT